MEERQHAKAYSSRFSIFLYLSIVSTIRFVMLHFVVSHIWRYTCEHTQVNGRFSVICAWKSLGSYWATNYSQFSIILTISNSSYSQKSSLNTHKRIHTGKFSIFLQFAFQFSPPLDIQNRLKWLLQRSCERNNGTNACFLLPNPIKTDSRRKVLLNVPLPDRVGAKIFSTRKLKCIHNFIILLTLLDSVRISICQFLNSCWYNFSLNYNYKEMTSTKIMDLKMARFRVAKPSNY